jgi:hypothetical protein
VRRVTGDNSNSKDQAEQGCRVRLSTERFLVGGRIQDRQTRADPSPTKNESRLSSWDADGPARWFLIFMEGNPRVKTDKGGDQSSNDDDCLTGI